MATERLYSCPNCDEWVLEDEWEVHEAGCKSLEDTTNWVALDWFRELHRRRQFARDWADQESRAVQTVLDEVYATGRNSGFYGRPQQYQIVLSNSAGTLPSYSGAPPSASSNSFFSISIFVPDDCTKEEATALIREQVTAHHRKGRY